MPDRLTSMTRNERGDGSGDLIFEQFQQRAGSGTTTSVAANTLVTTSVVASKAAQIARMMMLR